MTNMPCSNPSLFNCEFIANSTQEKGGGVFNCMSCSPRLTNCIFHGNTTANPNSGGALFTYRDTSPVLTNCILSGNGYEEIINAYPSDPIITYSIVQGGSGESWFGTGCLDTDPLFVDADGPDDDPATWADNDFRLRAGSPCIDAGDNSSVPADKFDLDGDGDVAEPLPFDLDGLSRFLDDLNTTDSGSGTAPIIDMGAYEFHYSSGDLDEDGDVDLDDYALFAECMVGPGVTTPPAGVSQDQFDAADIDDDGDVDLYDFSIFQRAF